MRLIIVIIFIIALLFAANLFALLIAYLRYKQAAKKTKKAKYKSILPTAQIMTAKEQKAILDKYSCLFFGAFALAYNKAKATNFMGKEEADKEQIYDLLFCSDVCHFAAKDGQNLRQFVADVADYCLPLWAFETKQVKITIALIIEQLDFILTFD